MLKKKLRYSDYTLIFMLLFTSPYALAYPHLSSSSLLNYLATMLVLQSTINLPGNHNTGLVDANSCDGSCQFEPQLHEYFQGSVLLSVRAVEAPCSKRIFDEKKEIWFGGWSHEYSFIDPFMMKIEKDGSLTPEIGYDGRFAYSVKNDPEGISLKILFKDVQPEEAGFYGARFRIDSWPPVMFSCILELRHILHGPVQPNINVIRGNEARFQYIFNPTVDNEIPSLDSIRFGPQQKNGSIQTYLYWQKDKIENTPYQNAEKQVPLNFSSPTNTSTALSNPRNISLDLSGLGNYTFAITLHGVDLNDTGRYLCDIEVTRTLKTFHTLTADLIVKSNLSDPDFTEPSTQSSFSQTPTSYPGDTKTRKTDLTIKLNLPTATKEPFITQDLLKQGSPYPDTDQKKSSRTYGEGIGSGIGIGIPAGVVITTVAAAGIFLLVRHLRNNQKRYGLIDREFVPFNDDDILLNAR